ncbi:MAG: hypothetical protein KGL39_28975 [Patescibacteria group bacterium]|nr:hypothetical protein [Patescibacteria group bacterium]
MAFQAGDKARMNKAIDSCLEGQTVEVLRGPYRVGYVDGVYLVRGTCGQTEEVHGSRLAAVSE